RGILRRRSIDPKQARPWLRRGVPELDGRILAGRGQHAAVWAERDVQDRVAVPGVDDPGPPWTVPDGDRAVQSPDRQLPPLRADGQGGDPGVHGQGIRSLEAGGEVPGPDPAIGTPGCDLPAFGMERDADHLMLVATQDPDGSRLGPGQFPDPDS